MNAFLLLAFAAPPVDGVALFEQRIRPVLVEKCESCHSAAAAAKGKLRGGLRLDSREGLRAGGDTGPALAPKADDSLLLQALQCAGDLRMPPDGKLPDRVVADFRKWIELGAPDPRTAPAPAPAKQAGMPLAEAQKHWAYRLPVAVPAPKVTNAAWPLGDLDRFVLAKLEAEKLSPAPDADRATLARRLYFDLWGLPPTSAQTAAFVADRDPQALENLVDRLLAAPEFGERWGRHWLDVARFAESATLRGFVYPEAWRYRDYVIDAFRRDVPYDRFVKEQLAGDLLPAGDLAARRRQAVATTYLALGDSNFEEQDKRQLEWDIVDEQLDLIGKGLLAQTITCARCHDHKFDPIPTADYYALAGVFRNVTMVKHSNVSNWIERPLPAGDAAERTLKAAEDQAAALAQRLAAAKGKQPGATGVLAPSAIAGVVVDDADAVAVGDWTVSHHGKAYIGVGYRHDGHADQGKKSLTFEPKDLPAGKYDVQLAYLPGKNRATAARATVFSAEGEHLKTIDQKLTPPIEGRWTSLGERRFEKGGQAHVLIANDGADGIVVADAVRFLPIDGAKPAALPGKAPAGEVAALEAELKRFQERMPKRDKFMGPAEIEKPGECRICVRGVAKNPGAPAPRGVLRAALHGPAPTFPANQSGRLELAEWLVSPRNPLAARVWANRCWHWLFGAGLVRTVDNFGLTGEAPSHPELLDALALRLVAEGWSTKKLVRAIVLSRTYRMASTGGNPPSDPDNRWLSHARRRRLDAECLRDAMLATSGTLSAQRGGRTYPEKLAADYAHVPTALVRSVYLPAFRNSPPELLRVFDGVDGGMVAGQRNDSAVAPQALFMVNHPFVAEQSRQAAARLLADRPADPAAEAYARALGRPPAAGERAALERFVGARRDRPAEAWALAFQALFATADFRSLD